MRMLLLPTFFFCLKAAAHQPPSPRVTSAMRVAHCIVGAARGFRASCSRRTIIEKFIGEFPGEQSLFVHFARTENYPVGKMRWQNGGTAWPEISRQEQEALAMSVSPETVSVSDPPIPACLEREHKMASACSEKHACSFAKGAGDPSEKIATYVRTKNHQECFEMVFEYERWHNLTFDFVTKLRPDAIFHKPVSELAAQVRSQFAGLTPPAVIKPWGGVAPDKYFQNDHMAVYPRAKAKRFAESDLYTRTCNSSASHFSENASLVNQHFHYALGPHSCKDVAIQQNGVPRIWGIPEPEAQGIPRRPLEKKSKVELTSTAPCLFLNISGRNFKDPDDPGWRR